MLAKTKACNPRIWLPVNGKVCVSERQLSDPIPAASLHDWYSLVPDSEENLRNSRSCTRNMPSSLTAFPSQAIIPTSGTFCCHFSQTAGHTSLRCSSCLLSSSCNQSLRQSFEREAIDRKCWHKRLLLVRKRLIKRQLLTLAW